MGRVERRLTQGYLGGGVEGLVPDGVQLLHHHLRLDRIRDRMGSHLIPLHELNDDRMRIQVGLVDLGGWKFRQNLRDVILQFREIFFPHGNGFELGQVPAAVNAGKLGLDGDRNGDIIDC